jgi:hypothetical protein
MRLLVQTSILGIMLLVGCQSDKPKWELPPLHAAKGTILRGGSPVNGGVIQFRPEPDVPDIVVNAEVKPDGTFELKTLHALSQKSGPGAPVGNYRVMYLPPTIGDQNMAAPPVLLPKPFTIKEGANEVTIELGKKS